MSSSSEQFNITGMHCASCSSKIEKSLKNLKGVAEAAVNFTTREAQVQFNPEEVSTQQMIQEIEKLGYQAQVLDQQEEWSERERREQKKDQSMLYHKLSWAVPATLLIVFLGMPDVFPLALKVPLFYRNLIQFILSSFLQFFIGWRFMKALGKWLVSFRADMDTLIGLGTLTAYLYSSVATFFPQWLGLDLHAHVYFETQAAIITFIYLGFYLESRAKGRTSEALIKLASLQSTKAILLRNGKEIEVNSWDLRPGDSIVIKPGQVIPIDGLVTGGGSGVNESVITGESLPLEKRKGDWVYAGSLNQSGYLEIEVMKTGQETALSQIIQLVRTAMRSKAPIAKLADQISAIFVPAVLAIAALSFLLWFFLASENQLSQALVHFVAVLIVACPCALGLATPTALVTGMGRGASLGILFRSGESLEKAIQVKGFIFDKTGTLTEGSPIIHEIVIHPGSPLDEEKALQIAASIERASEHRLALAFVESARSKRIPFLKIDHFESIPGKGVKAIIDGDSFWIGQANFLAEEKIEIPSFIQDRSLQLQENWATPVYLASSKQVLALFAVHDPLRAETPAMVKRLRSMGFSLAMLSGDRKRVVEKVAEALGIETYYAEVLPAEKERIVREFQQKIGKIAMVGDGVNDAPALAVSDLGISLASGTDIAREASDVTLLKGSVGLIPGMLMLAKRTYQVIRQNLFFSFIYNILLIPLAAGVFQPLLGLSLSPLWASIAMASSSLSVVLNSLRLKRMRL